MARKYIGQILLLSFFQNGEQKVVWLPAIPAGVPLNFTVGLKTCLPPMIAHDAPCAVNPMGHCTTSPSPETNSWGTRGGAVRDTASR